MSADRFWEVSDEEIDCVIGDEMRSRIIDMVDYNVRTALRELMAKGDLWLSFDDMAESTRIPRVEFYLTTYREDGKNIDIAQSVTLDELFTTDMLEDEDAIRTAEELERLAQRLRQKAAS